jgi:hypothetical protein
VTAAFDEALRRVLVDAHVQALGLAGSRLTLSAQERHVMAHATAWDGKSRLYRNHFCASEGHADWDVLAALCRRGLMRVSRDPSPISGGDTVFAVTPTGLEALRREEKGRQAEGSLGKVL